MKYSIHLNCETFASLRLATDGKYNPWDDSAKEIISRDGERDFSSETTDSCSNHHDISSLPRFEPWSISSLCIIVSVDYHLLLNALRFLRNDRSFLPLCNFLIMVMFRLKDPTDKMSSPDGDSSAWFALSGIAFVRNSNNACIARKHHSLAHACRGSSS
jgi:hypothetical protein